MFFPKLFLHHLVLKQVVQGYFDPLLTHFGPCNFSRRVEVDNFGTHVAVKGDPVGMQGRGGGGVEPKRGQKSVKNQIFQK